MAWICSNNPKHVFSNPTPDYFCDKCDPYTGILVEDNIGKSINEGGTIPQSNEATREVDLCIILMDASGSMANSPFKGSPLSRMEIVSMSMAAGIFDLENHNNLDNRYIAAFKFDHRVELMFINTVGGLLRRFNSDVKMFADDINQHLKSMQGQTNINGALSVAFNFARQFLNKEIPYFQNYFINKSNILKEDLSAITIPNIRVLLYTDTVEWSKKYIGKKSILKFNRKFTNVDE